MWITDGSESRYILKTDPIPEGWTRGRGSKFSSRLSTGKSGKIHEINGKLYNTGEAVKMLGISTDRFYHYRKDGFSAQEIYDIEKSGMTDVQKSGVYLARRKSK